MGLLAAMPDRTRAPRDAGRVTRGYGARGALLSTTRW